MNEYEGWAVALYAPCPRCKGTGKVPPKLAGSGQVDPTSLTGALLAPGAPVPGSGEPCPDCGRHLHTGYVREPKMITLADLASAILGARMP
jgi:hypothetical protein